MKILNNNRKVTIEVNMAIESCCECGLVFAMTEKFRDWKNETQEPFFCPAGHHQYVNKTKEEKEIERLEKMVECLRGTSRDLGDERNILRKKLGTQKGINTKLKIRLSKSTKKGE